MADLRYVIVSDLHFGAANSVMTSLSETAPTVAGTGFAVDPATPSPVLVGFLEGMRQLVRGQAQPPTLVLAGDILDLALSADEVSSTVFSGFASLAFGNATPVFGPVVYYVPGNHDHHLWETAREAQYVQHLGTVPYGDQLGSPTHVTSLCPDDESPQITSAWLTSLIQRQPGAAGVEVRVAYPNMALLGRGSERAVVISHGHFTESIYTLMSQLKDILYPGQRRTALDNVATWEEENFAWIDFLWSSLGQSGQVGADLGLIYADMATPSDVDAMMSNLTKAVLTKGSGARWLHPLESSLVTTVLRREVRHHARSERGTTSAALSPKGRGGLLAYLEGPVRNQLQAELGRVPKEVSFVFGHTHKPLAERWSITGFPAPVSIFNTGGWVVDTAAPEAVQGGVAVLVDDDLDVVPLQIYRQSGESSPPPVQLLHPDADDDPSSFQAQLAARIDPTADPWAPLTAAAAALTAQRYRLQAATTAAYRRD
jgi:UDP-2,3-diacylglucosamine pyrophosphatase LpxH